MSTSIHRLAAVALAALLLAAPAYAADQPPANGGSGIPAPAEKALREGAEKFLQALQILVNAIPQYEMPEMLPNGDIIIRRKHPKPESKPAPKAKPTPPDENHTRT